MEGQMNIFDFISEPELKPKEIGPKCNGCKYKIYLHKGGSGIQSCEKYGGCKYEPRGWTHQRDGSLIEAPRWMNEERCENCKWWEIYPVEEQPPDGWEVKGQCNYSHEPEQMKNGYWTTSKTSYCQDYKGVSI